MTYTLSESVLSAARTKKWMLATAESCTGGKIFAALTDVAGSSDVMDRGFITYSYESKTDLLDVPADMLEELGAVSEPVARQMAIGARVHSNADVSVAVTGVAGPGDDGNKKEGDVWFAIATPDNVISWKQEFGALGRDQVRHATVELALRELHRVLT